MYLEKLELQGFKSFAHKTTLDFRTSKNHSRITAIVGPNGSGKTNVAEAVRWVLGEQSMKLLRSKKSEDVIFSGSDKKARLGFAEVSLYLNNENGRAPIDYAQVVLTRKLFRSGESEYLINKSRVRLQDIQMLLAKAHFGQKTYSVIGQGMTDYILIAPPRERKEFFDEAAGVKQFQIKRDEACRKLEATEDNLRRAEVLIQEIAPRLRSLTRQVKRLERRSQVEKELEGLQSEYYGSLWQEIKEKLRIKNAQLTSLEEKYRGIEKKLNETQVKLKAQEKEKSRSKIFNELQVSYEQLLDEKNKLREKELLLKNKVELKKRETKSQAESLPLHQIVEELENYNEKQNDFFKKLVEVRSLKILKKLRDEFFLLQEKLILLIEKIKNPKGFKKEKPDENLAHQLEEISQKIGKINQNLEEVQNKIACFNQEEERKKDKFFALQRDFLTRQNELNGLSSKINESKIELARSETRKEDLEEEIKRELGELNKLSQVKVLGTEREARRQQIEKLKHHLELIGGVDPEAVKEYEETTARYDFLSSQSEDLKKAIKSLEKVITDLDETIKTRFDEAFRKINQEFGKFFRILFGGGKAHLALQREIKEEVQAEDEARDEMENLPSPKSQVEKHKLLKAKPEKIISGIEISAMPPGKRLKSINMLSGGERAMTSIALICAIIASNPSPFVILDEMDAALDEANSVRFAQILDDLSHKTQFVVITHNRATMQKAGILYGVTMGDDGLSKLLSLKLAEAEKTANL